MLCNFFSSPGRGPLRPVRVSKEEVLCNFFQERFAGDVFKGLGVEGVFGQMSNDRQNVQAQNNLQLFMSQYTNGLFSPIPPAPPMPPA